MMILLAAAVGCGAPSSSTSLLAAPVKESKFPKSGVLKQKLPAPASSVTVAGGGRYLIFHLPTLRQLSVFDVSERKIVKHLRIGADDILLAAGMDKLLIVARDHKLIQRWDLATFKKELTLPLEETATIDAFVMGAGSAGPALLLTRKGARFYDPLTLKKVSFGQPDNFWKAHPSSPLRIRASLDGTSFTAWAPGSSPSGIRLLTLMGKTHVVRSQHQSAGYLIPSPDGSLVLTSSGVYSQELTPLNKARFDGLRCLPTYHPAYIMGAKGVGPYYGQRSKAKPSLSFFTANDRQPLITLPDLEELQGAYSGRLPIGQRIHFFPTANLLLTLAPTNEELILRRVSLIEAMKQKGIDYLFPSSVPPKRVIAGDTYTYEIEILSARRRAKAALNSGPEGMRLRRNRLTWIVPTTHEPGPESVILTLTDSSGQEVFHAFKIQVEGGVKSQK